MEEKVPLCLRLWQRLHIDFLLFIGLAAITAYGMLVHQAPVKSCSKIVLFRSY